MTLVRMIDPALHPPPAITPTSIPHLHSTQHPTRALNPPVALNSSPSSSLPAAPDSPGPLLPLPPAPNMLPVVVSFP
jgi:hypothetical protein